MIKNKEESDYSKAGRTDKGVSALGNVISLNVRTNNNSQKMNYVKMLNCILPKEIQILGQWMVK